ncbi:MAG: beta-galactosidase, partial [Clostridia bacterium]|nr:beta-galactosidase [Clostridia bacterium]
DKIYANGGRVILATPSGARPHWLAEKYPEVLRTRTDGHKDLFRTRHNHCYTSPVYREKVRQMNTRLAERYGKHPAVVAWHISNEYGGECFCPMCQNAFRDFLRKRYDNDIKKLNHAYWATFWSHSYDNFDQVEAPSEYGEKTSVHGLWIDWRRFVSYQTKNFMEAEIAAIRAVEPNLPTTINMMPAFYNLNYTDFADSIDVASWDSYPDWHIRGKLNDHLHQAYSTAFWHDYFRSMKQKPFLLMESAPGLTNWKEINKLKRPGMDRLAAIQAIAHGSDSVQYFQFRKSRGSQEKFHGAVVDHVGTSETRIFREVQSTGATLQAIDEVVGTMPDVKVAIVFDWETRWALDHAQGFKNKAKGYRSTCEEYYRYFWERAIAVDIVGPRADLSKYSLVLAPMLYMTSEETIEHLSAYVQNGGTLYATYTTGMVDESDLCYLGGFPGGKLKEVFGIWNEEIDTIYPEERSHIAMNGAEYLGIDYCEVVHARGAEVLATYTSEIYAGAPAMLRNVYGNGMAYYQAFRDDGAFKEAMLDMIVRDLKIPSALPRPLPKGVTAHMRRDDENGTEYLFVENYSGTPVTALPLGGVWRDLESGESTEAVSLGNFDVRIFKKA